MFSIVGDILCVVFGTETIRESDSNMIKVVKGGFNPRSVLWNLTFFTWLNNDAITRRAKGRVCFSSLLWPVADLKIWKRLKKNGWHLKYIVPVPFEKDRNSLNLLHTYNQIFSKTHLYISWWMLVSGWNMLAFIIIIIVLLWISQFSQETVLDLCLS